MRHKIILAACLAAGALAGVGAQAAPAVVAGTAYGPPGVIVQSAPPAPIYEAMPAPRAGYIWTPGFYEWRGDRYVWNSGRWAETRPGYAWEQARWVQRGDGSWVLAGGHWVRTDNYAYRDRDRDGVPNRMDRDRDGDGVPNRYDDYPNNPNRY